MKKAYILTFFYSTNYGSKLQATALGKQLESMGYEVRFIKTFWDIPYLMRHPSLMYTRVQNLIHRKETQDFFNSEEYEITPERQKRIDQYNKDYLKFVTVRKHAQWKEILKYNPVFIAGVLTLLILVDWALKRYLEKSFPAAREPIRFISDRKPVSLLPEEIRYIESNDKEVMVYATEGRRFRNKTGISQWESILGDGFVRIHRSYLVNRAAITSVGPDSLTAAGQTLPISRKYRNTLASTD